MAIKAIQKYKIQNKESFRKEFGMLVNIDHPNIINIIEIWDWNDVFFLVTEFCEGGDLLSYTLERSILAEDVVKKLIK